MDAGRKTIQIILLVLTIYIYIYIYKIVCGGRVEGSWIVLKEKPDSLLSDDDWAREAVEMKDGQALYLFIYY